MAGGWSRDGAVQDQIDASIDDAVKLARSRLPNGEGLTHCQECKAVIPDVRRKAIPGVRLSGPRPVILRFASWLTGTLKSSSCS